MDRIFNGLDFVVIYIDDILVASKSHKEHIVHLREVLNKLRSAGLVLNLPKCTFGRSSVDFLGHLVSSQGIRPLAAKVEALCGHPQLNTIKELKQFLGLQLQQKVPPQRCHLQLSSTNSQQVLPGHLRPSSINLYKTNKQNCVQNYGKKTSDILCRKLCAYCLTVVNYFINIAQNPRHKPHFDVLNRRCIIETE